MCSSKSKSLNKNSILVCISSPLKIIKALKHSKISTKGSHPSVLGGIQNNLLKYKTPLQRGGPNDISNLGLVCPTCFSFSQ